METYNVERDSTWCKLQTDDVYLKLALILTTIATTIIYLFCYLMGGDLQKIYYVIRLLNMKSIFLDDNLCTTCITFNNYCQSNYLLILLFKGGFVTKKEEKILCILDTKTCKSHF